MCEKKVLIIKLGAIGDVIQTTIIASAIKQAHPNWKVHYLTHIGIANLIENHPHIDDIIIWDSSRKRQISYVIKMGVLLFKSRYDYIFNLTNAVRNILLSYLAFPKKVLQKKVFGKLWVEDYFLTAQKEIKDIQLPERLYMETSKDSKTKIIEFIKNHPKPYFVITPGGFADKNRQGRIWNIEKWKDLTQQLLKKYGGTIFVCGDASEIDLHKNLERDNVIICSGKYSLSETGAFMKFADLVISGDTGPLHIASAFDVKTLALLGSTSPDKIKPYGKNGYFVSSDSDCLYCWKKKCKNLQAGEKYTPCMENLSVEKVMNKINEILN